MFPKSYVLFFCALAITVELIQANSVISCPYQIEPFEFLGEFDVKADAEPFRKRVRSGRLPPTGLYNDTITCILIVDTTFDVSPGTVEVVGGGVYERYVEVKITSQTGKKIEYTIQAYTKGENLEDIST